MTETKVCSLYNLAICALIKSIEKHIFSILDKETLLQLNKCASKTYHALDLRRLCYNILTQKIVDIEDIIFEFRKITYYYKFYGVGGVDGVCKTDVNHNKTYTEVCNVWISAHFPINEIIPVNKINFLEYKELVFHKLIRKGSDFYDEEKKRGKTTFDSTRANDVNLDFTILDFCSI
jgi:hypothetical protein